MSQEWSQAMGSLGLRLCCSGKSVFRIQSNPMILKMQGVQLIAEACRQRVH